MRGAVIGIIAAASAAAASGGGGTATAPVILASAHAEASATSSVAASISGVQAGDLLVVFGATYDSGTAQTPTLQDTINGSYSDSNTYTLRAGPLDSSYGPGSYQVLCAWTAVAAASGTVTFRLTGGTYPSLVVLRIGTFDAAILEVAPASLTSAYVSSGAEVSIDLASTSYSHCLILGAFNWIDSERIPTYRADWPFINGRNDGNDNFAQMAVVGKQVTSAGNYDPVILAATVGTNYTGIALAIRGKAV